MPREYIRKDSEVVSKTRLPAVGAEESKRTLAGSNAMDTSVAIAGKRERPPAHVAGHVGDSQDS